MKKLLLVFLVASFSALLFAQNLSISKDVKQGVDNYKSPEAIVQVHYDGANSNAIGDGGTTFFGAAKYRPDLLAGLIGGDFQSVDYYINDMPTGLTLYVWDHTSDSIPGALLLMQPIDLGTVTANSWNTVALDSMITITGDVLWVGFEVVHADGTFPLGIDAGPVDPDGDWVNDTGVWEHLAGFGLPNNWNIRANVENNTITFIPVTFQADMSVQVLEGSFDPATNLLVIRGDFQTEAGDMNGDWQGDLFALTDADADTIYDVTANFPDFYDNSSFLFKFVISPDGWEAADNRPFTVMSPGVTLPVFWFSNDSIANVVQAVTNTLNFTADISGILGLGAGGAFDPAQDSLVLMGLDWDGLGQNVKGNRTLVVDPFNPGIFRTTLSVTSGGGFTVGDSTKWKFKAFPGQRFSGDGWESGGDRWHIYQMDGATIDLPTIVPRISPVFDTLANDINVTFNVDLSNPVNRYSGEQIDPATLDFVGMRGGAGFLGDWSAGGNWVPDDTTSGVMKVLTDMGNNIWSRTVFLPGGTQVGGAFEYKFAMMYPGADTVNGGSSPLDNEGGFGVNHNFALVEGPDIVLNNFFGDFVVSVEKIEDLLPAKYELEQNYPNPFNPSTTIRYSIPQGGLVTVKIFNLLGEEVATLVNEELTSGVYEVNFNANAFASGIYFYTLNVGNFVATKKMILLK